MFAEERRQKIAQIIESGQSVRVSDMANMFKTSEATIRRDLIYLQDSGKIVRTHGGAVGNSATSFEPSFLEKQGKNLSEKEHIGKVAASLINDGDTIILDSGTTTQFIVKYLTAKKLTIITNSVNLAHELSERKDFEVIVTGGILRGETKSIVGPLAETCLKQYRVDKAFVGANGVSIKYGVTTPNYLEACTKKAMIECAKEAFLVVDSTKFNEVTFAVITQVSKIKYMITDKLPQDINMYKNLGVEIITDIKGR